MEGDSLTNFYNYLERKKLDFKEFARRQVRKENYHVIELTPRQQEMWEYYIYDEQGYDHIRVNGDGVFRPEIVRAVSAIRNTIEGIRERDHKARNKLDEVINKQRRRDNGNRK